MDYFNTIGYVFQPSAEEILTIFLPRRLANEPIGSPPDLYAKLVKEIDLYQPNKEPSEIFRDYYNADNGDQRDDKCFYFFTRVTPVSAKAGFGLGKRSRRTAGKGTWRAEKPEEIRAMFVDGDGHGVERNIGVKGLFKYTLSPKEEAEKFENSSNLVVSWIMHEYRMNLGADNPLSAKAKPENHNIVFCCVKKYTKHVNNNVVSSRSKRAISLVDGDCDQDCNVAEKRMVVSFGYNYQENAGNANNEVYMIEGVKTGDDRQMVEVDQVLNLEQPEEMKASTMSEVVHVLLEGENEDNQDWTSSGQDQLQVNHNGWTSSGQDQNCYSVCYTNMLTAT